MADGLSVWPEVDVSDSEDEDVPVQLPKKGNILGPHADITEEDLKGFPPLLSAQKTSEESDEDSTGENDLEPLVSEPSTLRKSTFDGKLRELHMKRNEARKLNHQEVAAEDQRKKLPKNYEARRLRAEWELEEKEARAAAIEAGEDYDRMKMLEETADEVDLRAWRKKRKQNPDEGFSDYASAQLRQYQRLTKQMKPDTDSYQEAKGQLGEAAFPGAHNLMYGGDGKVTEAGIDRMVEDLNKQIEKRGKFHRRRQHFDESDIDYINERNMEFNKKAERFYGQYTAEIKQNLERGTAI